MKNNSQIKDLEQMLATLEHAGRDERRQQAQGEMIDSMAAADGRRHGFWWWGARVAAAACMLFFISTAVRIWFIPTDNATLVAENRTEGGERRTPSATSEERTGYHAESVDSAIVLPMTHAATTVLPVTHAATTSHRATPLHVTREVAEVAQAIEQPEVAPMEEAPVAVYLAETEADSTAQPEEAPVASPIDDIAAPMVSVAYSPTPSEPKAEAPKRERRSLLGGLFHRDDISHMDGTTLAINLL